jgi:tRNA pseudouridine38-40 synthase
MRMGAPDSAVLLTVAYDGRLFAGFAIQPSERTIEGELLGALRAIDPTITAVRGASRTDAGVHARDQRVAFDPQADLPPRGWAHALRPHLPEQIAVRRAAIVPRGFTPRFESLGKRYRYLLLRDLAPDPFLQGRAWRIEHLGRHDPLARLRREAGAAVGTHDFRAFRSSADPRTTTVRTLRDISISEDAADPRILCIDIEGNAFMHNMVRILVGTFVDVARGRLPEGAVARAIASGDRRDAGITAPAAGLYLQRVLLRHEGDHAWPPDEPPVATEPTEPPDEA